MRFTPQQAQEITAISRDTLRHWRKVLKPIADKNGYRPCFTLGDVLALKVVKLMVDEFGIAVGTLADLAPDIFKICREKSWVLTDEYWLIINLKKKILRTANPADQLAFSEAALLIPMGELVKELQQIIMGNAENEVANFQIELPLPPGNVKQS